MIPRGKFIKTMGGEDGAKDREMFPSVTDPAEWDKRRDEYGIFYLHSGTGIEMFCNTSTSNMFSRTFVGNGITTHLQSKANSYLVKVFDTKTKRLLERLPGLTRDEALCAAFYACDNDYLS